MTVTKGRVVSKVSYRAHKHAADVENGDKMASTTFPKSMIDNFSSPATLASGKSFGGTSCHAPMIRTLNTPS